jgi:hypothetical protein
MVWGEAPDTKEERRVGYLAGNFAGALIAKLVHPSRSFFEKSISSFWYD